MYWQGELSLYERACMSSFVSQGFELDLYSFDRSLQPPAGVQLCDAGEILPREMSTAYTQGGVIGSPTAFSNLFRYELLSRHGGIWMDVDVLCLRPSADYAALIEKAGERVILARENEHSVNCAIMMARPGTPVVADMMSAARGKGYQIEVWGTLGPKLVTSFAAERPAEFELLPVESFYPVYYLDFLLPLIPAQAEVCAKQVSGSYGLHLWNSYYGMYCLPKNMLPPVGSFLHQRMSELLPGQHPALPLDTLYRLVEGSQALDKLKSFKKTLAEKMTALLKEL
jgi:hypothetical protein